MKPLTLRYLEIPLSDEERVLVEKYYYLVRYQVKRMRPRNRDETDEWTQEGVFALVRAIRTFDDRHKLPLASWIVANVSYYIRKYRKSVGLISVPQIVSERNQCHAERARNISVAGSMMEFDLLADKVLEEDDCLSTAMSKLRPVDREVLDLHFKQGLMQVEIAKRWGMTKQAVGNRLYVALRNLRSNYVKLGGSCYD